MAQVQTTILTLNIQHVPDFRGDPVVPESPACPRCRGELAVSQPDPEDPDRLLGICESCRHWFLIEESGANDPGMILELPTGALREVLVLIALHPPEALDGEVDKVP
jgi:hypothetical protein